MNRTESYNQSYRSYRWYTVGIWEQRNNYYPITRRKKYKIWHNQQWILNWYMIDEKGDLHKDKFPQVIVHFKRVITKHWIFASGICITNKGYWFQKWINFFIPLPPYGIMLPSKWENLSCCSKN